MIFFALTYRHRMRDHSPKNPFRRKDFQKWPCDPEANPFPVRRRAAAIWEMLVPRDIDAFLAADWGWSRTTSSANFTG